MPFTILLYSFRKPGSTPTSFKSHYETTHIPLLKSLTGSHFPRSHKRFYIHRTEINPGPDAERTHNDNNSYPATILVGTQPDFAHDAIAELTFEDEARFHAFMGIVSQDEVKEIIVKDEEEFLDRAKLRAVVVGEVAVTEEEGA